MTAHIKWRFQRVVFMNSLNTNVKKPVLKEIALKGKATADFKSINHNPERVIRKANTPFVVDTEINGLRKALRVIMAKYDCALLKAIPCS